MRRPSAPAALQPIFMSSIVAAALEPVRQAGRGRKPGLRAVCAGGTQAADNVEINGLAKLLGEFQARRPIDHVSLRCHEAADVLTILWPPCERLHDEQILDRHHRDERASDRDRCGRIKDSPVNGTSAPVFRLMSDS